MHQYVVETEAKSAQWGDVNKTYEHAMKEVEGRYMRNLQQFGLTNIQDPMYRQQQQ